MKKLYLSTKAILQALDEVPENYEGLREILEGQDTVLLRQCERAPQYWELYVENEYGNWDIPLGTEPSDWLLSEDREKYLQNPEDFGWEFSGEGVVLHQSLVQKAQEIEEKEG